MSTGLSEFQTEVQQQLNARFGTENLRWSSFRDNLRVFVSHDRLIDCLRFLQTDLGFAMLAELGAADYLGYPNRSVESSRFEVHYVLLNRDLAERLIVKVGLSDSPHPMLPSVMPLWKGANWMEREIFDMYGIRFENHPDLRRILMPDEFTAHPLRKDYPLRGRGERHNFPRILREKS